MADKTVRMDGSDGSAVAILAHDTSTTDDKGREVYTLGVDATFTGGDASAANQLAANVLTGPVTETAPATDTASSGLNGRLQRIAQRLSSLIALLPTALGAGGGLKVDGSGTALPISGAVTVSNPTANPETGLTKDGTDGAGAGAGTQVGGTPGTGIRGWLSSAVAVLQAIKALLPTALGGNGGLKVEGVASGQAVPVSGTFYQTTQPVSVASAQAVDGSNVTEGTKADTAVTDSTTTNTKMSFLKGVLKVLSDIWDGTTSHALRIIGVSGGVAIPTTENLPTADLDITQKITVTNAGTPVQGPDKTNANGWLLFAKTTNTGPAWWMYHGQTAANKGIPIIASGGPVWCPVADLNSIDIDTTANGEIVFASKV